MKPESVTELFSSRNFLPLFLCQFLGAFSDNFIRIAAITLITYYSDSLPELIKSILVTLILALFMLPFVLFSVLGGQLADKFDKSSLIKVLKWGSFCVITPIGILGFYLHSYTLLLLAIFCSGCSAALFGPVKYSILPDHLKKQHLIWANGMIEAATFMAILLGMLCGGAVLLHSKGDIYLTVILLAAILLGGAISSMFLPKVRVADGFVEMRLGIWRDIKDNLTYARKNQDVFLGILGISWFWLVGGIMMSQLPNFTKDTLFSGNAVFTLLIVLFSIGTGMGSVACNRLLKGQINTEYVPISMLGMTIFMFTFWYASTFFLYKPALLGVHDFLSSIHGVQVAFSVLMIGICGGVYIVPLYTLLQIEPKRSHRSRIMASNNLMNAIFMIAASIIATLLIAIGVSVSTLILVVTITNFFTTVYIMRILPQRVLKSIAQTFFRLIYRVEVRGIENYYKAGDRVLIIANHTSFLDPPLLGAFLPQTLVFAIDTLHAQSWWIRPFLSYFRSFPVDPTNPMATKTLIEKLRDKQPVVIFPEGRITVTGSLMKIYEGPGLVADKAGATLLPIRIDGAQYTPFSRLKGKVKIRLMPQITITILEPKKIEIPNNVMGRQRRHLIGKKLYEIMSQMMFEGSEYHNTLFEAMLDARTQFGGKFQIIEDADHRKLTYNTLVTGSIALGKAITTQMPDKNIGVFLPNVAGTVVTFFGLQLFGRVPAMLNYSAGIKSILACCKAAQVRHIITARLFIEKGGFEQVIEGIIDSGIQVHYLEDIRAQIGWFDRLKAIMLTPFAHTFFIVLHKDQPPISKDPAVILFTSGSEGTPKGVVLSHSNIQANIKQGASCIDFAPHDIIFNALPIFHSFGLTGGLIMPIISGVRTFFYPSPLHYRIIPELVYGSNATIMYGTDTFLSGYAKHAHPYDFFSIRYIFAGAEKLREETRRIYMEKFGIRLMEAYGVTETAPGIAINTPMHYKSGSVGRLLPNIKAHLEPVEGIASGGKLVVSGPNVMIGYLKYDKPGVVQQPEYVIGGKTRKGWHDTGDIVDIDEDGYITILGRAKRFAKIAGEMISLAAIEEQVDALYPDFKSAVVSLPDERKGEVIVLFTESKEISREVLHAEFKKRGLSELYVPRSVVMLQELPVLATGKINYVALNEYAGSQQSFMPMIEEDFVE
jgi:acyl-[acyl-carrier-protein]-phospholipid O-acyltransferase/long-chain-fatty-acid--[acyl-carrier-protein] ligase